MHQTRERSGYKSTNLDATLEAGERRVHCTWTTDSICFNLPQNIISSLVLKVMSRQLGKFLKFYYTTSRCLKITEKVSFNITSEASYAFNFSGQKLIKKVKNGQFWRVFENL